MSDFLWSIDGSLKDTAVTVWDKPAFKRLHTCSFPTSNIEKHGEKLKYLRDELAKLKLQFPPSEVAMEGSFIHHSRNKSNKDIQQALGVTREVLHEFEPFFYQPKTVKLIFAGHGDATKARMKQVARGRFGIKKINDDEADSIGVGITHFVKEYGYDWNYRIHKNDN